MASETRELPHRSPATAVVLGLLLGQLGYAYTRQSSRMVISILVGTLALGLSFGYALHQFPTMFAPSALLDDPEGWERKLVAALGIPTLVATLNNVACAVDLYFQAIAINQLGKPPQTPLRSR